METVLFLCTGNYYRSRFAEEYFNFWAIEYHIKWRADSRGLRQNMSTSPNVGPISSDVVAKLAQLGIKPIMAARFPLSVGMRDFQAATKVIAICEREHRPMMTELFPMFEQSIEYWDIADYPQLDSETGLQRLQNRVKQLVSELSTVHQSEEILL